MKRTLKWLAIIVGAVVVLFVCAAILLPLVINPNDYKQVLVAEVKKSTGRDFSIDGDIGLSVFPWIGVELGKTTLGNAKGFQNPVFASADEIAIRVKLLPLLAKRVEMGTVTVHGLVLHLARNAAGRSNWDDLIAAAGTSGGGQPASQPKGPQTPKSAPAVALTVGGLDVRDATVTWDDAATGQHDEIRNFSARTGGLSVGKPVAFEVAMDVQANEPPIGGHIDAEGRADYDAGSMRTRVEDLTVKGAFTGKSLPGGKANVALAANVEHDGKTQTLHIAGLKLEAEDVTLTGDLRVAGLDSSPSAEGKIHVAPFDPKKLLAALGGAPIVTADPKALTEASLDATVGGRPNALMLKPLTVRLDASTLSGELSVPDLGARALRFDLAVDAIDADRYLPPEKAASGAAQGRSTAAVTTPGAAAGGASKASEQALRKLDVAGRMRIGKLKAAKLNMSDVDVSLEAKNGVIRIAPVDAKLYQGTYRGSIVLDARGEVPRIQVEENLAGVLAGPLLADLQGQDRITGRADVNLAVHATGATADAVTRTLNGSANFTFTDGAIKGVDVARMIREAYARIEGAKLPAEKAVQQTDFTEMRGTLHIKDGVASNDDFTVLSPLLRINGVGTANLPAQTVDYRVKATVVGTLEGQGGKGINELSGIPIPIHVTGSFAEPSYSLDVEALAEALAKGKAKEKLTDTIEKKVGDEKVKELLKGLLK